MISVFYRIESIVGENAGYSIFTFSHNVFKMLLTQGHLNKKENAGYQHFHHFPQYFQNASYSR